MKRTSIRELTEVWDEKELGEVAWQHEMMIMPTLIPIAKRCDRILEVGAGEGRMVRILQGLGVTADFCALDMTKRVKAAPGDCVVGDARMLPFGENVFDLVYSIGVVEHFAETAEAIKEHARVTRQGGCVFIMTPRFSPLAIYAWLRYEVGKRVKGWPGNFMTYVGKHLTRSQMLRYFHEANLDIFYLRAHPPVTPFPERIDSFFQRLVPADWFGGHLYCLGTKKA
jgi:ubiquinone/menaquinone biosynthesis C-methylase UbiE